MRRFYKFSQAVINLFWRVLFFLTLFFAVTSPNIILGDNNTFGTSTTMLTTGLVIGLVAVAVGIYAYPRFRAWLYRIFITERLRTGTILLLMVLVGQLFFVYFVHPNSGFDSGMLLHTATDPTSVTDPDITSYFSLNQNNMPIMLFMHWISTTFNQTTWEFFDFVTLFFVDLSAVLNLLSVWVVKKKALGAAMYIHVGWLAVFPSIIMPYTDAWGLPLVSFYLLCYFVMRKSSIHSLIRAAAANGFGISVMLTYFMKPSSIIPVIAIVIIEILMAMANHKHLHMEALFIAFAMVLFVGRSGYETYQYVNHKVENQTYIQIDKSRGIPAIHFMAMGVYGQGGYSWWQAVEMTFLPTKKQKTDYSVMMLKKRLKQLGPVGYLKFLVMKQRNNTADGTFGWLKEGHFFLENQKPNNKGITNKLKNFIYLYGRHIADFRFAAHLWWITLLTIIALGFGPEQRVIQILKVAMIGGFAFLLLFEGGRSRYIIQYLPCLLLLATISFDRAVANVNRLLTWYKTKLAAAIAADAVGHD
ncbi:TIGR03766 family XrtG-associated glycosyltransferase [Levilactobacillus mulengensis]|uniref:TIGR03766 family XrtG-associated glycosyltransferase n=1 Tax=Levilactobacillus mulengensis TaxID=2486025 RepID=UPI000F782B00|nr:TIGR03766 family XrtG-associated glycosyltransferase [Levilactobacillus mulengensis]